MSSVRADAKRRRMACGLAWAALSVLTACGGSSHDADDAPGDRRSVAPPAKSTTMPAAEPVPGSPEQPAGGAVDMPKPMPGGQSGSDSGGSTSCAVDTTMLGPDDATPWGITLSELLAQASDPLSQHGAVALLWLVGDWKVTALHIEVDADASGAYLDVPADDSGCAGNRIAKQVTVHLRSDDGLIDQRVAANLNITGDDTPYFVLQGSLLDDALAGSALEQALVERGGIDGFQGFDQFDDVDFMLGYEPPGVDQAIGGGLELWLRDDANGDGTQLIQLASVSSADPVPSPRTTIAPPAALAGECSGLTKTSALEPPNVAYEDRLAALKGTWILCGGDRAEPIALDLAGVVVADDGSYVHVVQDADGSLQQRLGFTHQGTIEINDAIMGDLSNFVVIHAVVIRDMVLDTDAGMAGAGSRQIELSADRNTMRWVLSSELDQNIELVFHRSELPVSAAPASSYGSGERGGAAACDGDERDLQVARTTDWQDVLGGSWVWCSGGPSDGAGGTLELDAGGAFRQLDATGHATSSGSYALMQGNPPEVHYLQLTPESGDSWAMFALLAAQTPRKLLVLTSGSDGASRVAVLSAAP